MSQCLQWAGRWSCLPVRLLWPLASPHSCRRGGIGFHNPSFQAPTRLLEGEECAGENIPTAVKRHSFLCPFLGWPFLHPSRHPPSAGNTCQSQLRVTCPCHHPVSPWGAFALLASPLCANNCRGDKQALYEETLCFSLVVLLGQSLVTVYLGDKSPGSPGHALHARQ